jgi:poly(A)-specific ribonuclease
MVSVDITKANFHDVVPAVKQALERCTFFAVDCEMTGLHTDGARHEFLDDHQTRLVCGQLPRNLEHCAAVT